MRPQRLPGRPRRARQPRPPRPPHRGYLAFGSRREQRKPLWGKRLAPHGMGQRGFGAGRRRGRLLAPRPRLPLHRARGPAALPLVLRVAAAPAVLAGEVGVQLRRGRDGLSRRHRAARCQAGRARLTLTHAPRAPGATLEPQAASCICCACIPAHAHACCTSSPAPHTGSTRHRTELQERSVPPPPSLALPLSSLLSCTSPRRCAAAQAPAGCAPPAAAPPRCHRRGTACGSGGGDARGVASSMPSRAAWRVRSLNFQQACKGSSCPFARTQKKIFEKKHQPLSEWDGDEGARRAGARPGEARGRRGRFPGPRRACADPRAPGAAR